MGTDGRSTLDDDLALAHRAIDLASEVALAFFHRGVRPQAKQDGTPVTEADLEVERQLLDLLARERPDDAVLSEEAGARGRSGRRWIVDPIDGTVNFVAGAAEWGTHVALEAGGEIVLGVISRPVTGGQWWAIRGGGAHRSDQATGEPVGLRVSTVADLAGSRVSVWSSDAAAIVDRLRRQDVICTSRAGLDDLGRLAAGELEAVIGMPGMVWDHAPAVVLVEEAGGRFTDPRGGRRLDLGSGRYTNAHIDPHLDRLFAP